MAGSSIEKPVSAEDSWGVPTVELRLSESLEEVAANNPELRLEQNANGEVIIMSPTGGESGFKCSRILSQLDLWSQRFGGRTFDSSTLFRLPNGAKRSTDVSWISIERWNLLSREDRKQFPPLCPDFLVELRSETDRLVDLQAKMDEYTSCGLRLGWLIDPLQKRVHVYRNDRATAIQLEPPTIGCQEVLPGFVLELNAIWADS